MSRPVDRSYYRLWSYLETKKSRSLEYEQILKMGQYLNMNMNIEYEQV